MAGWNSKSTVAKMNKKISARSDQCGMFIPGEPPCTRKAKGRAQLNTCGKTECMNIAMIKNNW